jgi:hypothetical protein
LILFSYSFFKDEINAKMSGYDAVLLTNSKQMRRLIIYYHETSASSFIEYGFIMTFIFEFIKFLKDEY